MIHAIVVQLQEPLRDTHCALADGFVFRIPVVSQLNMHGAIGRITESNPHQSAPQTRDRPCIANPIQCTPVQRRQPPTLREARQAPVIGERHSIILVGGEIGTRGASGDRTPVVFPVLFGDPVKCVTMTLDEGGDGSRKPGIAVVASQEPEYRFLLPVINSCRNLWTPTLWYISHAFDSCSVECSPYPVATGAGISLIQRPVPFDAGRCAPQCRAGRYPCRM